MSVRVTNPLFTEIAETLVGSARNRLRAAFDGHRLLTEDVDARLGGSNGVFGMHRVGECDIHRINLRQAFIELVVGEGVLQAIPLGEFTPLGSVAADDGDQFRVAPCMRETWQYGDLCDVAKAYDCVTNAFSRHVNTSLTAP